MRKQHVILAISTTIVGMFAAIACGGQAVTESPDGGTGGSSTAGTGGAHTGGTGGAHAGGTGGSHTGGGGSGGTNVGGTGGGSGGGTNPCPPPNSCNWCGGEDLYDNNGCIVGYRCANGVDPCSVGPCQSASDCDEGEVCGSDMLCWPTGGPHCSAMQCSGGGTSDGTQTCTCDWSCNGEKYGFDCKVDAQGALGCECRSSSAMGMACASPSGNGPANPCDDCCGFPKPDNL